MNDNPNVWDSIRLNRKLLSSDVWKMGPLAVQVWIWLLLRAVWKPEGFTLDNGIHLQRGQVWFTYPQLQDALKSRRGKGFQRPSLANLKRIVTAFQGRSKADPIADRLVDCKADYRGVVLTICKYDDYNPRPANSGPNSGPKRISIADPEEVQKEEVLVLDSCCPDVPSLRPQPIGQQVCTLWGKLRLPVPPGYDHCQAAVRLSSLTKHYTDQQILDGPKRIADTPDLAWAGKKGPGYLAAKTRNGEIVLGVVLDWQAKEEEPVPVWTGPDESWRNA